MIAEPSQEDIDHYHGLYMEGLTALWEAHKDAHMPNRIEEMQLL